MRMSREPRLIVPLLLPPLFALAGTAVGGPPGGAFGVGAQVVAPHRDGAARSLPLPMPGHVMQDDARGRHYFFEGELDAALRFFDAELQRLGYRLHSRHGVHEGQSMRWQRDGEAVELELRAASGAAPTRVRLRVSAARVSN